MSKRKPPIRDGEYEVGYGKPPKHTRFVQGQSGNPAGRPKGTRNFKTDLKATLEAPVNVTRDGKPRKMSTQKAMLYRLREKALVGEPRALDRLISLALTYNNEELFAHAGLSTDDVALLELFIQRVHKGVVGEQPPNQTVSDVARDEPLDRTSKRPRQKKD